MDNRCTGHQHLTLGHHVDCWNLALHAAIAVHKARERYEYQETGPFPYHLSGDIKALAGVEAFSTLREFVCNTDNHN